MKKAFLFMENHTDLEVAEAIVKQFPSTSISSIETSIKNYKKIDAWKTNMQATSESFTKLQNIMKNAGELNTNVDFDKIVDNTFAKAIFG